MKNMDISGRILISAAALLISVCLSAGPADGRAAVSAAVSDTVSAAVSAADTVSTAAEDSTEMFNALDYSLQKRYMDRGEPFVKSRFSDNTFLSIHAGTEQYVPFGYSTFAWGASMRISYGKWFDAYNALRISLAADEHFNNQDKQRVWGYGIDVSHMFNISRYFGGYKPGRFFEISTVEGLKYRYTTYKGDRGINAVGIHGGFNLKMNVARNLDFFVEPIVTCYSDGVDHSGPWNWRIYDIAYGGTMGLSYRFHSDKDIERGPDSSGESFVSLSAGPQFQNSALVYEKMGLRSMGGHYVISYGKWFSNVFALRVSGFFSHDRWIEYVGGERRSTLYYGARVEGMLDMVSLCSGGRRQRLSVPVIFGPEIGGMTKRELENDIRRAYLGLSGGLQVKYRVSGWFSVFVEPHFSIVPYSVVEDVLDPLKNVGTNYYDNTISLNLGVEFSL